MTAPADTARDAEEMQQTLSVTYNTVRPRPAWADAADRQASWMDFIMTLLGGLRAPLVREASAQIVCAIAVSFEMG